MTTAEPHALHRSPSRPPRLALALLLTTWLVGCGARPGLDTDPDGAPDGPDTAADAAPLPDAEVLPTSCTWIPGARHQVTEPPNDKDVHSVVVSGQGALVAWRSSNPDPPSDTTHYVQRLAPDGAPIDEAAAVFPPPGGWNHAYASLAAGEGRLGAVVWDDAQGCRFRALDPTGIPLGESRYVGADRCAWLRVTPAGFTAFSVSGNPYQWRLINLDAQGALVHTSPPIEAVSGGAFWWSSARLSDGSLVVAGMDADLAPTVVRTQRVDAQGAPLGAPVVIADLPTPSSHVGLLALDDHLLAGWLAADSVDSPDQERALTLQRLDLDGQPVGAPWRAADVVAYRDAGWSFTRHGDQVLAALVEPLDGDPYGDRTALVLLPLSPDGALDAAPVELTAMRFLRRPKVRSTPQGVIAVFTGITEPTPHQLHAVSAACVPDPPWPPPSASR